MAELRAVVMRPDADAVWIEHFYLDTARQGQGIGSWALAQILRMDTAGRPFRLNVLQGSPARRLYDRHGFVLESEDLIDVYLSRPAERSHSGELHGETVVLRRLRASDAPAVHAAFASADDMARQGDVTTLAEAERYVVRLLAEDSPHEPWAIVEGKELIGLVAVSVDEENLSGWFWYWMTHRARRRGLTARAAATIAQWALSERGVERLELGDRVDNPASAAVARAAGFVKEGTERGKFLIDGQRIDVDTYGRLRSDPAPVFDALPLVTCD